MNTDVIVAGGGPVGMLLACELRLAGVAVTVLERLPEPSGHSRAFRLQSRTLELFDQRGLLEPLLTGNRIWPKAHFAGLEPLLDLSRLDSAHPYALLIPQARTEAALEARALELGADVRRGHELTALSQADDQVIAEVRGPDGRYRLDARYLVGCDGGRSTTRKAAGIAFEGTGGSVSCLLGDVHLADPGQLPSGVPGTLRTDDGLLMAVSLEEEVTRVLVTEFGRPMPDDPVTLDELRTAIRRVTGTEVGVDRPRWLSRFSDATRLAERYRTGRVLLAGDSAHIHFPIGAQGLNLGLQDAMNLGWKLAAQVQGRAAEDLLDTYGAERRPAARRVLQETRAQLLLMTPGETVTPLRELFSELLALPEVNLHLSEMVTGLDVRYDDHPVVGARVPEMELDTPDGRKRIAVLLRDGKGLFADLTGDTARGVAAKPWADRVNVVTGSCPGPDGTDALLIRPDGYVAWAGSDGGSDGLADSLSRWFGAA